MNAVTETWKTLDRYLHEGFGNEDSSLYRHINTFIVFLIFVSIVSVTLASVTSIYEEHQAFFEVSEYVIVGIFTAEYLANIYVAHERRKYIFGWWGIIDFLAIAPSIFLMLDIRALKVARVLRVMRFLRLMRILRVLKLAKVAARQFEKRRDQKLNTLKMDLQIYFIALFSAVTIFSTLEFYAEEHVPNTPFTSIPAAMWWCIVTITTTGYGDMTPSTVAGRTIAVGTMLSGLALFGLLMNVVGKAMLSSLFGSSDLEEHDEAARKAEELLARKKRRRLQQGGTEPRGTTEALADGGPGAGPETPKEPRPMPVAQVCGCGEPLSPTWRVCPLCGTPTARGLAR